jgi:hypothetical protein
MRTNLSLSKTISSRRGRVRQDHGTVRAIGIFLTGEVFPFAVDIKLFGDLSRGWGENNSGRKGEGDGEEIRMNEFTDLTFAEWLH